MGIVSFAQTRCPSIAAIREWKQKSCQQFFGALSGVTVCAALFCTPASADPFREGMRAFAAHNYVKAAQIFTDLAPRGNAAAQTYLGYMYEYGKGVPQDFVVAAAWYHCASQQGVPQALYQLGLMYDNAQGVPQDYVMAYALLNLAVAGAGDKQRGPWSRVRDAVASKLSLVERSNAQQMSFAGVPEGPCVPIVTGVKMLPFPVIVP
jgi:hypothetical protein